MVQRIQAGSFYILCPDNETPRETDLARMEVSCFKAFSSVEPLLTNLFVAFQWNINDVIEDRPALSRWHEDYTSKFNEFVKNRK